MIADRLFLICVVAAFSGCISEPVEEKPSIIHSEFQFEGTQSANATAGKTGARSRAPSNRASETVASQAAKQGKTDSSGNSRQRTDSGPRAVFPARGNVVSVNPELEFVVLEFLPTRVPAAGTELTVFRNGKPIGKVRVTEPKMNNLVTADLISGAAQRGDEARKE